MTGPRVRPTGGVGLPSPDSPFDLYVSGCGFAIGLASLIGLFL